MQGPPRAIWCPVSHRAASVEAGGLRWGDTRVKGVSEHLSLLLMQLYELDGDPRRKEFLDDLFSFMQKRGESPAACPPCAPVPTLCPSCSTTPTLHPPHPPQGWGLISSPLITAPRSRLQLSCWLIFNPSAQQGQTCWAGSSACSPPLPPLPAPITPRPAAPPHRVPLPTKHPWPCAPSAHSLGCCRGQSPSLRPLSAWGEATVGGPGVGRAESQACSCSRVWFLRGKQRWKC